MSYDANIDAIWKDARISKNGIPFKRYDDLPEGDYVKSQLKQEDGSTVIVSGFRFVLRIYDNGTPVVFRNPIKSNDIKPTNHRGGSVNNNSQQQQPQVILSSEHIEWIQQAVANSQRILESVERIERLLTNFAPPWSRQEGKHQNDDETRSYEDVKTHEPEKG